MSKRQRRELERSARRVLRVRKKRLDSLAASGSAVVVGLLAVPTFLLLVGLTFIVISWIAEWDPGLITLIGIALMIGSLLVVSRMVRWAEGFRAAGKRRLREAVNEVGPVAVRLQQRAGAGKDMGDGLALSMDDGDADGQLTLSDSDQGALSIQQKECNADVSTAVEPGAVQEEESS